MSKERALVRASRQRGFTLVELLVVLAILGLILTVAGTEVMRTIKRSYLNSTVQNIQLLATRALLEAQRRGTTIFLRVGAVGSGPNGTLPVEIWADANANGTFEAASDLLIQQILLDPKRISLSTTTLNPIESANWSNDTDTSVERLLACNTFGRAINPATFLQIAGTATLSVTHTDMVANVLQPRRNDQLRISPAWGVQIVEISY